MESQNTHPLWISRAAHTAVIVAAGVSAGLLYQKLMLSHWEQALAIGGAVFVFIGVVMASEGCGVFSANLIGLFIQKEKSVKEIVPQLVFATAGAVVTGAIMFGLAFFSIKNIVALQSVKREAQTISINDLPKVKPLYETVKSLELALQGAQIELNSAQERFKSYEGTNQYQNQGKANQAAIKAQERKDRLETRLEIARTNYLTAYTSEEVKGTNLLDRADGGFNSKLYVAGMFEIGAVLMALAGIMLSAYSKSFTLIYLALFKWPQPKGSNAQKTENKPTAESKVEISESKSASQFIPGPLTLIDAVLKVKRGDWHQKDICQRFGKKPYEVSRLIDKIQSRADKIKAETGRNGLATYHEAAQFVLQDHEDGTDKKTLIKVDGMLLEQWLAKAAMKPAGVTQIDICHRFNMKPYLVSRLVRRIVERQPNTKPTYDELVDTAKGVIEKSDGAAKFSVKHMLKQSRHSIRFVYFIKATNANVYKIGITRHTPAERLTALQTACPYKLSMFGYISCQSNARELELKIHQQLADFRKEGEWFELSDEQAKQVLISSGGVISAQELQVL